MRSYQFGLQSLYESIYVDDKKKYLTKIYDYISINQPNVSTGIQCGICVFISFNSGHDLIYESKSSLTFSQ